MNFFNASSQSDALPEPWLLARGLGRSVNNSLQPEGAQQWSGTFYQSNGVNDPRLNPLQGASSSYQDADYASRNPHARYLDQPGVQDVGPSFQMNGPSNSSAGISDFLPPPPVSLLPREAQTARKGTRHTYSKVAWEEQLPRIRELYLDRDHTLEFTMNRMAEERDFIPSERAYKKKFEELGWRKNLQLATAQFIINKQQERGRPTDFLLFDNPVAFEKAEETVRRARGTQTLIPGHTIETPTGLLYRTPPAYTAYAATPELSHPAPHRAWTPQSGSETPFLGYLPLVWRGNRLEDIVILAREADEHERQGDMETAERKYREALAGYQRLLSPTHADTLRLGYKVAKFYAKQARMTQADEVLDWMNKQVVERWGLFHDLSRTHFQHIISLYNEWSRNADARTLMDRLSEALAASAPVVMEHRCLSALPPALPTISSMLNGAINSTNVDRATDKTTIEQQLRFANRKMANNPSDKEVDEVKSLIGHLMRTCEENISELSTQLLKGASILMDVASALVEIDESDELETASIKACAAVLRKKKGLTVEDFAAAIAVGSRILDTDLAESSERAEYLFQLVSAQAERVFSDEEERETIGVLITIGNNYEKRGRWNEAKSWYEYALSVSMSGFGVSHRWTKALETALENQHFPSLVHDIGKANSLQGRPLFAAA